MDYSISDLTRCTKLLKMCIKGKGCPPVDVGFPDLRACGEESKVFLETELLMLDFSLHFSAHGYQCINYFIVVLI